MLEMKEKIILYLTFAKTKLDLKVVAHQKAMEEINQIITNLEAKDENK